MMVYKEFTTFFQGLLGNSATELPCFDVEIARDGPCLSIQQHQEVMIPVTRDKTTKVVKELPVEGLIDSKLNIFRSTGR